MHTNEKRTGKAPINPFTDWGFKYLFGREENKELLKGFLNLLLEPEVNICDLQYLNTELLGDRPELKRCVVDVLAADEDGNKYLIEMQNATDHDIRQRLVYYSCRLVDQMGQHSSEWDYGQIKRVFAICMMNFTYERNATLREDYQLRNPKGDRLFSDILTIIPLQLPCIKAKNVAACRKSYEVLLYLLQSMSRKKRTNEELLAELDGLDLPEQTLATFRRVVNTVEEDLSESERRDYEVDLEKYIKTMGMIRSGREEGWQEGREEGREEGLAEGLAKGREERSREIAKLMKEKGYPIVDICTLSGLTEDEVAALS